MTKSELKPGYVVKYRNGMLRMVMPLRGSLILVEMEFKNPSFTRLEYFNENLTNAYGYGYDELDIMEVYGFSRFRQSVWRFDENDRELLWKRQEKKKYTYEQLKEILGEEFEVVG